MSTYGNRTLCSWDRAPFTMLGVCHDCQNITIESFNATKMLLIGFYPKYAFAIKVIGILILLITQVMDEWKRRIFCLSATIKCMEMLDKKPVLPRCRRARRNNGTSAPRSCRHRRARASSRKQKFPFSAEQLAWIPSSIGNHVLFQFINYDDWFPSVSVFTGNIPLVAVGAMPPMYEGASKSSERMWVVFERLKLCSQDFLVKTLFSFAVKTFQSTFFSQDFVNMWSKLMPFATKDEKT